jgi:branched-chain amino acid transport system permease protein
MDLRAGWQGWRQRIASSAAVGALAGAMRKALELGRLACKQGVSLARAGAARAQLQAKQVAPAVRRLKGRTTDTRAAALGRLAAGRRRVRTAAKATGLRCAYGLRPVLVRVRRVPALVRPWARSLAAHGTKWSQRAGALLQSAGGALRQFRDRLAEAARSLRQRIAASPVGERARTGAGRAATWVRTWLRTGPLAPATRRVDGLLERRRSVREGRYRIEVATPRARAFALAGIGLVALLVALPAFASRNLINELIFVCTMLVLAQYWNLLAGYAGLVSVGQQAFVGLGGYVLFALTVHAGLDPLAAILAAGVAAALLALPAALVVFRLRGAYFAIGTWVVAEVFRLASAQIKWLGGGTGTSLPPFVTNEVAGIGWVRSAFGVSTAAARDIVTYWAALTLAAGTILLVYLVLRSRYGLALAAIRDSERAAESVGVDNFRTKLKVYIVAAAGTGMVGALIYLQKARISPDAAFSVLDWTANVIFIVVIGGIGTIEGPIVGVLVFYVLQSNLAHFGAWYLILLGVFAIVTMLFAPKGIWGYLSERYGLVIFPIRRRLVANRDFPSKDAPQSGRDL